MAYSVELSGLLYVLFDAGVSMDAPSMSSEVEMRH